MGDPPPTDPTRTAEIRFVFRRRMEYHVFSTFLQTGILVLTGYKNGTQVLGYVVYAEGFGAQGTGSFRQGYAAAASVSSSVWQASSTPPACSISSTNAVICSFVNSNPSSFKD